VQFNNSRELGPKPISRRVQIFFLAGFAVAVAALFLPDAPFEQESKRPVKADESTDAGTAARPLATLSTDVLARIRYKDSLQSAAAQLHVADIHYSLQGADSSELTTSFGPSTDDAIPESYLTGASRNGYPLDDAMMRRLGFKLTRSTNAYGAVWERKVGGRVRYVARSDSAVAASVADIQRVELEPSAVDGHQFNASVPLFVSKDALKAAVRMIEQGMTDPGILAPYTACAANEGDSFILIDGSWTVSKVMLTSGVNRGCQGWTANEFTQQK
jgi:hypothetical protein